MRETLREIVEIAEALAVTDKCKVCGAGFQRAQHQDACDSPDEEQCGRRGYPDCLLCDEDNPCPHLCPRCRAHLTDGSALAKLCETRDLPPYFGREDYGNLADSLTEWIKRRLGPPGQVPLCGAFEVIAEENEITFIILAGPAGEPQTAVLHTTEEIRWDVEIADLLETAEALYEKAAAGLQQWQKTQRQSAACPVTLTAREDGAWQAAKVVCGRPVMVTFGPRGVELDIEGYGVKTWAPGQNGGVVYLDMEEMDPHAEEEGINAPCPTVYIWSDVNQEDFTHRVPLRDAADARRNMSDEE